MKSPNPYAPRIRSARSKIRRSGPALAAILTASLFSQAAHAAGSKTWSNTAVWGNSGAWIGGIAPVNNLTGDIAVFNSTTFSFQPTLSGSSNLNGIQIGDGTVNTGALTFSGAALALGLGSGGISLMPNAGAANITVGTVKIGASQPWVNNSSSLLTVSSDISNYGNSSAFTVSLTGTGSGGALLSGAISNGGTTGKTAITVNTTGNGVTTLSGINTYTGATTLSSGILRATTSEAALGAGTLNLGGGELRLANDSALNFGRPTTVSGNVQITLDRLSSGVGVMHSLGTLSIGAQTLSLVAGSNVVGGPAGLRFAATTLTGNATLSAGANTELFIDSVANVGNTSPFTLTLSGPGNTMVTGAISNGTGSIGTTALTINTSGGSVTTLAGTNLYTGTTTLSAGVLKLAPGASLNQYNDITLAAGTTFELNGNGEDLGLVTNNGIVTNSGAPATLKIGNGSTGAGLFSGAMDVIWNQGGASSTVSGSWSNTGNLTFTANSTGTISLTTGTVNNVGSITNSGLNTGATIISANLGPNVTAVVQDSFSSPLTLSGDNTNFAGPITVYQGTLKIGSPTALGGNGSPTGTGGELIVAYGATLDASVATTLSTVNAETWYGDFNYGGTAVLNTGSGAITLFSPITVKNLGANTLTVGGALTGPAEGSDLTLDGSAAGGLTFAGNVNIAGLITNQGTGTGVTTISGNLGAGVTGVIQNSSTRMLKLNGDNSSLPPSTVFHINAGTLQIGSATALGTTPLIWNDGTFSANATFTVSQLLSGSGLAGTNNVNLASGVLTIGDDNNLDTVVSGTVSGAGGLDKAGGGTLTLRSAHTNTGVTTLTSGTLVANTSANALGVGAASLVLSGGVLDFNNSTLLAFNRPTTVNGEATIIAEKDVAGPGVLYTLGNLSIGTNTLNLSGGNVSSGVAGLTFGATTLSGNPTFNVANPTGGGASTLTIGALADGGIARTLTKTGAGTLNLATAATSFVNGSKINIVEGTLNSNVAAALGTLATVDVADGAILGVGVSQTIGALSNTTTTLNTGSVSITGAATLTIGSLTNNLSSNFSGVISGTSGLVTKGGTGTLTLSGTNTYGGLTTVSAGTLKLGAAGTIKSGNALTTAAAATFDLGGNDQALGILTTSGTVTNSGAAATLTIGNASTGAGSFTGAMNVTWNQAATASTLTGSWSNTGDITLAAYARQLFPQ